MWLKFPNAVRRQLRCNWEVALEVLYHACQLRIPAILEEINAEASIKSPLGGNWPKELFVHRYKYPIHEGKFTFSVFAVAIGLTRYLSYILGKSDISAEHFIDSKAGRPLLHYAIELTGGAPQPETVRFLLSRGANSDAHFDNKPAMQSFVIPESGRNGEPRFSVITALLEGGADAIFFHIQNHVTWLASSSPRGGLRKSRR